MRIAEGVFEKGKLLTEEEKGLPAGAFGTGRVWRKELFEDVEHAGHIVIWTLEPGGQAPLHLEKSDEVFIVISGEMVTWNHTEEAVLKTGQASLTLSGEYHGLRNDSNDLLVVLIVY